MIKTKQNSSDVYKWVLLGFLWTAFFLHQGTRQIYNAILPQIQNSFGVTSVQMGLVATVFAFTYGICAMPSGIASDLFNRKRMVVCGLAIFCSGIFFCGWVSSIGAMIVLYGLFNGAGQAFYYPAACSLLSQYHEKTRSTALAIHQTALYIGIILCGSASGYFAEMPKVCDLDGWRIPFLLFGGFGILWAFVLGFGMRNLDAKPENVSDAKEEKATLKEACLVVVKNPAAILITLGFGAHIYVDFGFKTWMPTFLNTRFDMNLSDAAFNAVVWHYIGAILGVLFGGRISDKFSTRFMTSRIDTSMFGLLVASPFIFFMANASSAFICCAMMLLFGIFRGMYDSNMFASLFDVVPKKYRASASGLMLSFAFIMGSTAPAILGFMRDEIGIVYGMMSLACIYFVGGIILLVARLVFFKRAYVG